MSKIATARLATTTVLTLAFVAALLGTIPAAEAMETDTCTLEIVVDGQPLTEHQARGTTYIEALEGREYAIRLTNRTGGRLAVALAVDGLNSIDAKTTDARSASKWVLGPHQTITVEGWQTSADTARRFFFTTEGRSYGAWLGETANLGVIEAVAFREKRPRKSLLDLFSGGGREVGAQRRSSEAEAPKAAEAAPDDLAATGIGRKVDHNVRRVHLDLEDTPTSHLRIRYEYRPQLVRLGVLPSPEEIEALERRERARGFEGFDFAPDPFARGRR